MEKLTFNIDINAPKEKVWDIMLAEETYRQWTEPFHAGSYFEGSWEKGSKVLFLGPNEDGTLGGMVSRIAENIPYEYISIESMGVVENGKEDTESEEAKQWAGSLENYTFRQEGSVTHLLIELESKGMPQDMVEMFKDMWPNALQKLKTIVESR